MRFLCSQAVLINQSSYNCTILMGIQNVKSGYDQKVVKNIGLTKLYGRIGLYP